MSDERDVEGLRNRIAENVDETLFVADPGPHPEVFYYGTRGYNMGGQLLRDLWNRARGDTVSMRDTNYFEWREDMATDEQGYVDNERQWNRGQLSRFIRSELQAHGLIPGLDGNFNSPQNNPTPFDGKHPVVHSEWIDHYRIQLGDGWHNFHPEDVQIVLKHNQGGN